jgi:hypothetical protein
MRKFVISLAAAGAALVVASPAAAQYYPQQQPYGYGYNGYGNNNYGQLRSLEQRINAVQYRIDRLGNRGGSNGLRNESRNIERRLRSAGRNGLNPYEANDIQNRIARLEQRVNYAMASRNGRYGYTGYNNYNGYNGYNNSQGYHGDRDRDDRDHDYGRDDDRDD